MVKKTSKESEDKNYQKILEELFAAQAHLGHKTNRIHPQARKYIYRIENGVSIIDLTQTAQLLNKAKAFLEEQGAFNKVVLFVATKKIASHVTQKLCAEFGLSSITAKWPAGFLTNFDTIMKNTKKMKDLREAKKNGEWSKLVKHEQSQLQRELNKLERVYGGLSSIKALPDTICIIDIKTERNAYGEALAKSIPVVALVDTNVDPNKVTHPIPANDDSSSSVEYILRQLVEAYVKGRKSQNQK